MDGDTEGEGKKIHGLNIPDELVHDILSRLPVQSLLRFKCISKSWLSIITHPNFIKTHRDRSTQSLDCHRLLLRRKRFLCSSVSMDFETPKPVQCPWPWGRSSDESDSYLELLCSCDGLILVCFINQKEDFVLWNPTVRSYKRIKPPYEPRCYSNYGLCYDSVADDYRVFLLKHEYETTYVVIYSLRNDSWNVFKDNRNVEFSTSHAVVNGTVHWSIMSLGESYSFDIVYFDLVEEKLKEVPKPCSWKEDEHMDLVVLGGYLCAYSPMGRKRIEVYAMKEYGKKESWATLLIIPGSIYGVVDTYGDTYDYVKPLCLTKKGQVLISFGAKRIGIYDPKNRTLLLYDDVRGRMATPFVETLVSLN